MISSEVQRTLVKSPPELWAELSDPDSLARHLGELGEIRIVRTEAESTVEWAAENTTGTVSIKPSGWGTKVTLSVTRELAVAAPAAAAETPATEQLGAGTPDEPEASAAAEAAVETAESQVAVEPEAATVADAASEPSPDILPEPQIATEPQAIAAEPMPAVEPEPRRGFFARLFGRRRREAPSGPAVETVAAAPADQPIAAPADPPAIEESAPRTPEAPTPEHHTTPDAFAAVRQVLEPGTFAAEHPFAAVPDVKQPAPEPAAPEADSQQTGDIAAELLAAEEAGAEEVTAVLTAVLDRLGAAHHRPFSRS